MKKVLILVLAGLLLAPAAAPSQTIRGMVVEDGTRTPIPGARVQLLTPADSTVATAETDSAGAFLLSPRRSGSFVLRLRHLGYAPVDSVPLTMGPGERIEVEVRMGLTAIPLEPVVVTVRGNARLGGFYERLQRPGFGRFLTREDIEARRGANRASDLLRMMPGVEVVPAGGSLGSSRAQLITMRGGTGRCLATIYIDGMRVQQFADSGVDDFLTAEMLEGVEVYTGGATAPSPIHSMNSCGVVAFWTRSPAGGKWSWRKLAAGLGGFVLLVLLTR